jgi:hypothetical protein
VVKLPNQSLVRYQPLVGVASNGVAGTGAPDLFVVDLSALLPRLDSAYQRFLLVYQIHFGEVSTALPTA